LDYHAAMSPNPPAEGRDAPPLDAPGAGLSRTGQVVGAFRAGMVRPATPDGDPGAQAALCAGIEPALSLPLQAHLEARTRFFDTQVLDALDQGTDQVVILGAGYDDRALRFRSPGVRFFEVDHPVTQADKRHRLEAMGADCRGLTLVPADFRVDGVAAALEAGGHRGDRASLVLAEGLLVYLDEQDIVSVLAGARSGAAPGSTLAASLAVHPAGVDSAWVVEQANAARPGADREPWRTILPLAAHLDLVVRAGWRVAQSTDDAALGTGAPPDRSVLVVAHPEVD
jgi:methyltransferase (TIGR00027 family)